MKPAHRLLSLLACAAVFAAAPLRADELGVSDRASGLVIHDASETLHQYCATDSDGTLWLTLPGGARYQLVTSTSDRAIANPGDGAFHSFDSGEVRAALATLGFPVSRLSAEVFILPYPRRAQLESAAGPGLILLSPGVRALSRAHQHAEFVHELGHVMQYALLPDGDARWAQYRQLRAIQDASRYSASSDHADRPHEIFAEDFRALFGDADANYSGSIENASLTPPAQVAGLARFLLSLTGAQAAGSLAASPNPTRGAVLLSLPNAPAVPMDLFDASGRRVATVAPTAGWTGVSWSFSGVDDAGRKVAPGVLYARPRGMNGGSLRVVVLP